jgi:pSer/pThr/pTyr-binding forkhead associated (FHA) protein
VIACPNCGKENQDHYKFCLGCGSDLPRVEERSPAKTQTPPTGIPAVSDATVAAESAPGADAPTAYAEDTQPPPEPSREPAMATEPASSPTPEPESAPSAEEAPAQEAAPSGDGTTCPSCGAAVPDGFAFCGACGTPVGGVYTPNQVAEPSGEGVARLMLIQPDGTEGGHVEIPTSEVAVGRDAGGFFGADPFLSPTHAIFCAKEDTVIVRDADSLNGTYVKITPNEPVEIRSGAIFRMGQELVLFEEIDKGSDAPDGTFKMGSPIEGLWGRVALIVGKGRLGNAFTIGGEGVVLGRERGDIVFPEDGYVSGVHLKIFMENGKYYLNDLGSSNGTFFKLSDECEVGSGSFLLMGQQLFRVDI